MVAAKKRAVQDQGVNDRGPCLPAHNGPAPKEETALRCLW